MLSFGLGGLITNACACSRRARASTPPHIRAGAQFALEEGSMGRDERSVWCDRVFRVLCRSCNT
eukprot:3541824-Pleurochrysis_carterae.AAC.3